MYPMSPSLSATQTPSGMGGIVSLVALFCKSIAPTCGPFPCVMTGVHPCFIMVTIDEEMFRVFANCSWMVPV